MNKKFFILNASFLFLLLWVIIGTGLRFTQLESKSPWTDEFSTMVFSLGNSYRTVPLDEAIALDVLLQPLQPNPANGIKEVVGNLLSESNHPPLYFILVHLWMKLFPSEGGLVSLWVARALPALFGSASILAMYGLGLLAFRSRLVAQLAAALMAVSPYGIFLAQEARHYSLAILFVIGSLSCLVFTVKHISQQKSIPLWIVISWIAINNFGIATHYFFGLTLCAETIVILAFLYRSRRKASDRSFKAKNLDKGNCVSRTHNSLLAVAAGTIAGSSVWLLLWQNGYDSQLTEWIKNSDRAGFELLVPIFQAIAAWITMLSLLPVEVSSLPIVIVSGLMMVAFFLWAIPVIIRGIKVRSAGSDRIAMQTLGGFVLGAIALFFLITYGMEIDLTRGARYNFVYFPAVILLVASSMVEKGTTRKIKIEKKRRKTLFYFWYFNFCIIWLMGLISALTVACNLGYQKYYRPDLLVPLIQQHSGMPALIATTHQTHVQTGELMGIAWEFKRMTNSNFPTNPQFILAHQARKGDKNAAITLQQTLTKLPRPLNLWLVNFHAPIELKTQNCFVRERSFPAIDGYDYQMYLCKAKVNLSTAVD